MTIQTYFNSAVSYRQRPRFGTISPSPRNSVVGTQQQKASGLLHKLKNKLNSKTKLLELLTELQQQSLTHKNNRQSLNRVATLQQGGKTFTLIHNSFYNCYRLRNLQTGDILDYDGRRKIVEYTPKGASSPLYSTGSRKVRKSFLAFFQSL